MFFVCVCVFFCFFFFWGGGGEGITLASLHPSRLSNGPFIRKSIYHLEVQLEKLEINESRHSQGICKGVGVW